MRLQRGVLELALELVLVLVLVLVLLWVSVFVSVVRVVPLSRLERAAFHKCL